MTTILQQTSEALAAAVAAANPHIVRVEARRRLPATGIVWAHDGVIVTAHHVVDEDRAIRIGFSDGEVVEGALVGRDPTTDVAVIRVQRTDLTPPAWTEPALSEVHVGNLVLALGRPQQSVQATLGIISALGDSWRTPAGGVVERYLQTDVVMYPGFSGGPLVDAAGHFVGLNTSSLLRGISLTVPIATLQRVVGMLLAHGRMRRGYLGTSTQPVRLPEALVQQLGQETGLLLIAVEPDSPAAQGGLVLGDTLVAFADTPIRQHDDLLARLGAEQIDREVVLRIIRSGQVEERRVLITERG